MIDEMRVQRLLDELHDSRSTPEEVCQSCPELLPEVRERWQQVCRIEDELDDLFPPLAAPQNVTSLPRIPNYEVESILGHGGMGVVFLARHLRLNRRVALKMAGTFAGPRERQRFQREAEAVAALRHPNIVQIYDVGECEGRPYFTMEHIEGGSLARKLAGAPQPARKAAAMLATLADAVQVAHASGIIHRDLKPANVLLTVAGTAKISDFGLARRLDGEAGLTCTGTAVGTPSYMAPEQALGKPHTIGPAADIYALGAILYEMLTGRPPFRAETAAGTVQQVITQEPVSPSRLNGTVPRDLEIICLKCLHKEPRLRYASAAALADDLRRFLNGEAIAARPYGPLSRLIRRIRRRPGLSTAIALSAILSIALAAIGLERFAAQNAAKEAEDRDQAETKREVGKHLQDSVQEMQKSNLIMARASLDLAKVRLGTRDSADLKNRLGQITREWELLQRLRENYLGNAQSDWKMITNAGLDDKYQAAFREAGFADDREPVELVAERIKASNIRGALVAAFDDWAACTTNETRRKWLLTVATLADPALTDWRTRARQSETWHDKAALADLLAKSPVDEQSVPLLLALEKRLRSLGDDSLRFLIRIQQARPADYMPNFNLGTALDKMERTEEAVRYFQAAIAIWPEDANAYNSLGMALAKINRPRDGVEYIRKALQIAPDSTEIHHNLCFRLVQVGLFPEALEQIDKCLAIAKGPPNPFLYGLRGVCLERLERKSEAAEAYQRAARIGPDSHLSQTLRIAFTRLKQWPAAQSAWQRALATLPPDHADWYGYAELCLFLGMEDEYRRARKALLAKFGASNDLAIAERTSRACLLLPASAGELKEAVVLAGRAGAADKAKSGGTYPYFQFCLGLAEYRQGRYEQAIAVLRGEAAPMPGPLPRLVLAMAQHRSGHMPEARRTLALAIAAHDWRPENIRDQDGWIAHVLRREAEGLILPNLPAFLEGKYQPRDNDERLAFMGICQFTNRTVALARLYADAFDAWAAEGIVISFGYRYDAARGAAMAGCGRGADAAQLDEPARAKLRQQARQWLRADLAALSKALKNDPGKNSKIAHKTLLEWRAEPDFNGLRDQPELHKLHENEGKECQAIWDEINRLLQDTTPG